MPLSENQWVLTLGRREQNPPDIRERGGIGNPTAQRIYQCRSGNADVQEKAPADRSHDRLHVAVDCWTNEALREMAEPEVFWV